MNVLMISGTDVSSNVSLGVSKKIMGQYKAFNNLRCNTWLACLDNGNAVLKHDGVNKILVNAKWKSYFTVCSMFEIIPNIAFSCNIELCYIRYPLADWAFMRMVRRLHKICKVVVEIPTYPYDRQNRDIKNFVAKVNMLQDCCNRKRMKKSVDLVATFSNDNTIYGIPCVSIFNGVNITQCSYLGDKLEYKTDIHLIGVARIQRDHGYDRVIKGIYEYEVKKHKDKRKIFFHVVGTGQSEPELRELVKMYGLEKKVIFYGPKYGKELENIYSRCQIGVGIMGSYRSGIKKTSALKNREYCAIGIPFIGSAEDDGFPRECAFYRLFPNDDSSIDMKQIVEFFDDIKIHSELHAKMRKYAETHLSWEAQLSKVLNSNIIN